MRGRVFSASATSRMKASSWSWYGLVVPARKRSDIVPVVLAEEHVNPRCTGEVEARVGVAQDLVEMRRQAPAFAVTLEQPERERRSAEHVGRGTGECRAASQAPRR